MNTFIKRNGIARVCLLTLIYLLFTNFQASASDYFISVDGFSYVINLENGTATLMGCSSTNDGKVTVPSEVKYKNKSFRVTKIGSGAFSLDFLWGRDLEIQSITIPDGITIEEEAFSCQEKLKSVRLPSDLDTISNKLFYNCKSIETLNIPEKVSYIGDCAFCGCKSLHNMSIPKGVTYIGAKAFDGCTGITELSVPASVTSIGKYALARTGIKTISLPNNIKTIPEGLFSNSNLEYFTIEPGVTEIGDSAFARTKIKSITLPDSLTKIGLRAFAGSQLKGITIPDGVTIIRGGTFEDCIYLSDVKLSPNCEEIRCDAFNNCTSLVSIVLPDKIKTIHGDDDKLDAYSTFYYCTNLKSIHLPDSLKQLYLQDFYGCENLKQITLPDNTEVVWGCNYPQELSIEEIDATDNNKGTRYISSSYEINSSVKRIAIASSLIDYDREYQSFFRDLRLEKLKVLPSSDGFERITKSHYNSSLKAYYQEYAPIYADSLYICDSDKPINCYESSIKYSSSTWKYYRTRGDYRYLYMGRDFNFVKGVPHGPNPYSSIDDAVGDSLRTLVIGPLITKCTIYSWKLTRIESLITNPLQVEPSFPSGVYVNAILIVPDGTKSLYEQAPGWKEFFDIQEAGSITAISNIDSNQRTKEIARYNLNGQKLSEPEKGINIVKYADGTIKKVLVK